MVSIQERVIVARVRYTEFPVPVIATTTCSKYVKLLQASAWTVDFTNFWRVFAICHNCVTARHAGRALRVRNAIKRPFAISIYAINKKNFSIVVLVTVYRLDSKDLSYFLLLVHLIPSCLCLGRNQVCGAFGSGQTANKLVQQSRQQAILELTVLLYILWSQCSMPHNSWKILG